MHYSLMGKMRLHFIDSDLLYRGSLYLGRFDCTRNDHITLFQLSYVAEDEDGKIVGYVLAKM